MRSSNLHLDCIIVDKGFNIVIITGIRIEMCRVDNRIGDMWQRCLIPVRGHVGKREEGAAILKKKKLNFVGKAVFENLSLTSNEEGFIA